MIAGIDNFIVCFVKLTIDCRDELIKIILQLRVQRSIFRVITERHIVESSFEVMCRVPQPPAKVLRFV